MAKITLLEEEKLELQNLSNKLLDTISSSVDIHAYICADDIVNQVVHDLEKNLISYLKEGLTKSEIQEVNGNFKLSIVKE